MLFNQIAVSSHTKLLSRLGPRAHPWTWKAVLLLALLAGFGLRMINLANPPLDFASTRQLFSALKARGMYYQYVTNVPEAQRQTAIALGDVGIVEPPLLETIVAQTYRLTGEHLWVARIYSSLFWVAAGIALFFLIRELASPGAAMIATLFYLFLPFGVIASRAFMPDPLMVSLSIFALWALLRWKNTDSWKWAILFGLFAGAALFVKNVAAFIVVGGFSGVVIGGKGLRRSFRNPQVWAMAILLILPAAIFMLYGSVKLNMGSQFALRFFPKMWIDPAFYFRWAYTVNWNIGWVVALFAAVSVFLADPRRDRPLLIGLWIGYFIFGLTFPYAFYTHDYYHLSFIPVAAISMAPGLKLIIDRFLETNPARLPKLLLVIVILIGIAVPFWYSRDTLLSSDYHAEPQFWAALGDRLGHDPAVVALSQDYGYRLAYWGWQGSTNWFTSADLGVRYLAGQDVDLLKNFAEDTAGKDYFVVTMFAEFDKQPAVEELLKTHYPVFAQTDDYIIYDLRHPLQALPQGNSLEILSGFG